MSSEFTSFKPKPANAPAVTKLLPEPAPPARKYALNMPGHIHLLVSILLLNS